MSPTPRDRLHTRRTPYGQEDYRVTDIVDVATRSRMMSGIRARNTRPEIAVRRALHARGFRFRLHDHRLPGSPDIILPKFHATIFVHGCFWHRHEGCKFASTPSTRPEFWEAKFQGNKQRDNRNLEELLSLGWRVATIWECALRLNGWDEIMDEVGLWLRSEGNRLVVGMPA